MIVIIFVIQMQTIHPLLRNQFKLFDVISFAFGALTQQGSSLEIPTLSGRLVVLTTFLANLALFTSYSGKCLQLQRNILKL